MMMARYFIDLHNGRMHRDRDGENFATDADARTCAQAVLCEMIDDRSNLWADGRFVVELADEARNPIARLVVTAEILKH